jgi:predicted SAM-dependent methyltransferase
VKATIYRWIAARPVPFAAWTLVRTVRDRWILHPLRRARTRHAFARYARSHPLRKVTIGCGEFPLEGWFNTDLEPTAPGVAFLDATRPLPFPPASVDLIESEHCIEHLSVHAARALLAECRRVLRSEGVLRIVVPDLEFAVRVYGEASEAAERYRAWFRSSVLDDPEATRADVLNAQMRLWGHQFLYDQETMESALGAAGFADVRRQAVGESEDPRLCRLEQHGRAMPEEWNAVESLVVEARATRRERPRPNVLGRATERSNHALR